MNKLISSALLLFSFTLAGYSQNQASANGKVAKKFSVSGAAATKSGGNLLSKAVVKFQKYSTNPVEIMNAVVQNVKTDENGRWAFGNLDAGEYKIVIVPPDFSNKDKQPKLATVTKIIEIIDEDIRDLIIELPNEATISGTVTLKGDETSSDSIFIIATDEGRGIVSGSPVNGKAFRIDNLSEGNYFLNLTADNDYYVKEIKLEKDDITNSTIKLRDGENVKNVQIVMTNAVGTVIGKVNGFNEDEGGLVVVLPLKYTAQNALRSSMPTAPDESGDFEIKVPPGEYFITIVTRQDMARRDKNNLEAWFRDITKAAQKIMVNTNETTHIEMKMPTKP